MQDLLRPSGGSHRVVLSAGVWLAVRFPGPSLQLALVVRVVVSPGRNTCLTLSLWAGLGECARLVGVSPTLTLAQRRRGSGSLDCRAFLLWPSPGTKALGAATS